MSEYYDFHGQPISHDQWVELFRQPRHVGLWEGEGGISVSTVWLGLNHNWSGGVPLIFETMIFGLPHPDEYGEWQTRYATLGEATEGHWRTVNNIIHGEPIWFG